MKAILKKHKSDFLIILAFILFIGSSFYFDYNPGKQIFKDNFWIFFKEMILLLPLMFILIGLFDVWIPKERIQKHIGGTSGIKGMLLVMLLAFIQAGPLYAAFPVTYLLWKKGCSPVNIFIYISAFTTAKIPMLTFEIGFLGLKFSLLRILITIPVFILIGIIMGRYFKRNDCKINEV
ncbi:hypothetical protein MNBD_IGNAVI01-2638 [hydrothermal vent metagenome]|uniref:Permease n=1 Tax=hydrothermal vent metagenome TaxID=652676 RepID=A0A3B1C1F7_9ZZZZ